MDQIRNFKQNRFGHLILEPGNYLGFEIWNLGFKTKLFAPVVRGELEDEYATQR